MAMPCHGVLPLHIRPAWHGHMHHIPFHPCPVEVPLLMHAYCSRWEAPRAASTHVACPSACPTNVHPHLLVPTPPQGGQDACTAGAAPCGRRRPAAWRRWAHGWWHVWSRADGIRGERTSERASELRRVGHELGYWAGMGSTQWWTARRWLGSPGPAQGCHFVCPCRHGRHACPPNSPALVPAPHLDRWAAPAVPAWW